MQPPTHQPKEKQKPMADETTITITGNLTADPEIRTLQAGGTIANFTIAHSTRIFDQQANRWTDGKASFYRCSAFRQLADNIAAARLHKGQRVIVYGTINQHTWQAQDGTQRSGFQITVQDIGASLMFANKNQQNTGDQYAQPQSTFNQQPTPASQPADPFNQPQTQPAPNGYAPADPGFAAFGN